jgi:hypothetical protein
MDPPPSSLEAMVRSRPGAPLSGERRPAWPWVVLLIIAIGALAYYLGLSR